jgi:hypothetical protein
MSISRDLAWNWVTSLGRRLPTGPAWGTTRPRAQCRLVTLRSPWVGLWRLAAVVAEKWQSAPVDSVGLEIAGRTAPFRRWRPGRLGVF